MTFTVATFNTLHGQAEIHPLADVIGWQEADTTAVRKRIRELDGYATYVPGTDALSAIPISWRTDVFELVSAGEHMTHAGKAGVTPNRGYSWAVLRHLASGEVVCIVNTHFISGAWSFHMTPWRRARWNEHMAELSAFVTEQAKTMPVVLVGDMNRRDWLRFPGFRHATVRVGIPIDQIHSTLPLSAAKRGPQYGSDHHAWTSTVTLPAKEKDMTIISRQQWGAAPQNGTPSSLRPSEVVGIVIHWPAMSKPLRGVEAVSGALRNWQKYHLSKGWDDIAYQEAVDQDGNVYVLRGLSKRSAANGDSTVNSRYGALLLVLAPGERPSDKMILATRTRIAKHRELFPLSREIKGHGEVRAGGTACPGPILQDCIKRGVFAPSRPTIHADNAYEDVLRGERAASPANKPKWRAVRDALAKLSTKY